MNERAYIGKAEAYAGMGEYGQAAAAYAVAVQTMPNGNDVWNAAEQQAEEVQRASSMVGLPFSLADLLVIKVFLFKSERKYIESAVEYPTTYDGLLEISREEKNDPEIFGTVGIWMPMILIIMAKTGKDTGKHCHVIL